MGSAALSVGGKAPSSRKGKVTRGWSEVPNSLIENQGLFTPAEFRLALIVIRKAGVDGDTVLTDANWENWTGLTSRMKEKAAKGLVAKGFQVDGKGEMARYRFSTERWQSYVRETSRDVRPRTAGRGVDAKPGAKVHPDCHEHGCALLCGTENGSSPSDATKVAKRVSQTGLIEITPAGAEIKDTKNESSPSDATNFAKRVSQTSWKNTLDAIQKNFPIAGVDFLARLLDAVRAVDGLTDDELAGAVQVAWEQKQRVQKSEGMFLLTVPEAIASMRANPKASARFLAEQSRSWLEPKVGRAVISSEQIKGFAVELSGRGEPFTEFVVPVEGIAALVRDPFDFAEIEARIDETANAIVTAALATIPPAERKQIAAVVEARIEPYKSRGISKLGLDDMRQKLIETETLERVGLRSLRKLWP